mmetsp:Transcript_18513/g.44616  ORF Transcript_18513/g.44616 Transcript_18513/m.44616 type:complete len:216 (-) Transcript_18513:49-696(-)
MHILERVAVISSALHENRPLLLPLRRLEREPLRLVVRLLRPLPPLAENSPGGTSHGECESLAERALSVVDPGDCEGEGVEQAVAVRGGVDGDEVGRLGHVAHLGRRARGVGRLAEVDDGLFAERALQRLVAHRRFDCGVARASERGLAQVCLEEGGIAVSELERVLAERQEPRCEFEIGAAEPFSHCGRHRAGYGRRRAAPGDTPTGGRSRRSAR